MTHATKKQWDQANVEVVRALIERGGASERVRDFRVPGASAVVELTLSTPGGDVGVHVENAEEGRASFARTPSFLFSHLGDPNAVRDALPHLRAFVAAIAKSDPGDLRLALPDHVIGYKPAWADDGFVRDPFWRRERFDERFAAEAPEEASAVTVMVTQACAMNCVFCPKSDRAGFNMHREGATPEDLYDDVIFQLERGRELGATLACLTGSDVLLFPHVERLCAHAGELGYTRISMETTGQRMADRAFAERLASTAATELLTPIYGADAALHDRIVGTPGAFDGLVRGIDHALELGRPIFKLHTILLASTLPRLVELIDFVRERFGLLLTVDVMQPNRDGEIELAGDMARFTDAREAARARPIHFRELPLCQMAADDALEVFRVRRRFGRPRPVHLYDLGMAPNEMHPEVRRSRKRGPPSDECTRCLVRDECPGTLGIYPMTYGASEFRAITDEAAIASALARDGEPFPAIAAPLEKKLECIADVVDPERLAPRRAPRDGGLLSIRQKRTISSPSGGTTM